LQLGLRKCRVWVAALGFSLLCLASSHGQEGSAGSGPGGMGRFPGVRGTVSAVSGSEYTLKTEEGATYKVETGANTRFTKQRQPIKAADVHVGDMVMAIGQVDEQAHSVGAAVIALIDPEQVKRMKESFGKTWIAGTVSAIDMDNLKITVKRADGVTQTIGVDENTSFRKHRESITLADVKVGDSIGGQGALSGDTFVAKELRVGEPGQMRGFGGGRQGHGPGDANAPAAGGGSAGSNPPSAPDTAGSPRQ
jgi:hypothetical protein